MTVRWGGSRAGSRGPLLIDQGHSSAPPGLSLVVGLVLYISSINDEVMNRPSSSEQYFHYRYGWSFAFAASSFLLKEVMSVGPRLMGFEWGGAGRALIPGSRRRGGWGCGLWINREEAAEGLTPESWERRGLGTWDSWSPQKRLRAWTPGVLRQEGPGSLDS